MTTREQIKAARHEVYGKRTVVVDGVELTLIGGGAGSYPDAPSRRMAWDDDGTILTILVPTGTGFPSQQTDPTKASLNSESQSSAGTSLGDNFTQSWTTLIFPELRELDGVFMETQQTSMTGSNPTATSGDTTNGIDGTWNTQIADLSHLATSFAAYRTAITSTAAANVRAVRQTHVDPGGGGAGQWRRIHIYGDISAGQTPDRLLYFDALTDLEFGLPIDYGDIPRGSANDRTFYLRNNSGSLTASSIQLTAEDLYLGAGSWFTFDEGTGFQSTLPLASPIGPSANSPTITLRRVVPDAAMLGLYAARVQATVGSWA